MKFRCEPADSYRFAAPRQQPRTVVDVLDEEWLAILRGMARDFG